MVLKLSLQGCRLICLLVRVKTNSLLISQFIYDNILHVWTLRGVSWKLKDSFDLFINGVFWEVFSSWLRESDMCLS